MYDESVKESYLGGTKANVWKIQVRKKRGKYYIYHFYINLRCLLSK
jgi:hypothetical protein